MAVRHCIPTSSEVESRTATGNVTDIVEFLGLGGEAAHVGPSSGFSLATNLGPMVHGTVWNKALVSTVNQTQSKPPSIAEWKKNSAGPPNDDMGGRPISYKSIFLLSFPLSIRILERNGNRIVRDNTSSKDQHGSFKIHTIYAIGATMLIFTEGYNYTPPENFFMKALQCISAAR